MSGRRARAWFAAAATAAACDVLAHRLADPAARTAARYGAALAVLGIARTAGTPGPELGLDRRNLASGARAGLLAGGCAAGAVFAAAAVPVTRGFFADQRADAVAGGGLARSLAWITFASVPPEELTYRSALLGLRLGDGSPAGAVAWSSAWFGLSHILPTLATMHRTAVHQHLAQRPLRQAAFVSGNVAVTSAAGAAFAWLRLRSGSVLAPLLAHAALNGSALAAGVAVRRWPASAPDKAGRPRVRAGRR
jgi:uncharacterized protein